VIEETPEAARQGSLGRPILIVVSTLLAAASLYAWFGATASAPGGGGEAVIRQPAEPGAFVI